MKKIKLLGLLFTVSATYAQSTSENYIQSKTCLNDDCSKKTESVTYFDGLGRPKQIVGVKATTTGKDLVIPITYDTYGRQTKDILPVPANSLNAAIHTGIVNESPANSYYGVANAYAEKEIENSPLDKVLQQAHPGDAWKMVGGHTVQYKYQANASGDIKKFITNTTTNTVGTISNTVSSLPTVGSYDPGVLYKNTVTDEDGTPVIQFTNGRGQVLLIRRTDGTQNVDTYYVYNEYGQQVFVIPPKAVERIEQNNNTLTQNVLETFCYQYRYDGRGRQVEKRLPGREDWESVVYDGADRPILSQDVNLKNKGQWLLSKYDRLNRVVYTGILSGGSRIDMQSQIGDQIINEETIVGGFTKNGQLVYYTNNFFQNFNTILTVNYYDFYPRDQKEPTPTKILDQFVITSSKSLNGGINTLTFPTATYIKNIEDDSWTKTYFYYDTKGRKIGEKSFNHLGGYTKKEIKLDFAGIPQAVYTYHIRKSGEAGVSVRERFVYDHGNRLKEHYHQVDSNPEQLLAKNSYNELSQLVNKEVGNNLQSIDYAYNIRGWMTDINPTQMPLSDLGGKLFAYKIKYNQKDGIDNPDPAQFAGKNVVSRYNGNIAEVDWRSVTSIGANPSITPKRYGYAYDSLNRLIAGYYQSPTNAYSKENTESIGYDLNGNISKMYRTSTIENNNTATVIDELNYIYSGNKLTNVHDTRNNPSGYEGGGNTITYDANGNMENMQDKGISSIAYNFLNLPVKMSMLESGVGLTYLYGANGTKLQKINSTYECGIVDCYTVNAVSDYLDGFQYMSTSTNRGNGGETELLSKSREMSKAMEIQAYTLNDTIIPVDLGLNPPIEGGIVEKKNNNLSFFPTAEGYYDYQKDQYIYQYKDHLGNVRISFGRNSAGALEITDANDYYPFGMNHLKSGNAFFGQSTYKNYKYNGKELQETGMYDYGARFYMPDLGRWGVADELAEKSRRFSPYTYALDNPIMFVDPDGREAQGCCGNLWNLAKTYYSGMYQGAKSVATGTYQGVKQVVTHPIESAKSLASNPGGALNQVFQSQPI
ncbi:DUF6443 domain-containing protein [Chryseobacterium tructae]|uniref:DUF6443 domain-containing protein n=1 Tax=Chryseobacterium tructae TaxID=1037380 RepID=UPI0025B2D192|nr:DUF6443 domain-containing protein [Chryseobacterium tructae]MDN3694672.1 DUF6443 domain-containing protein [Chryseobacterium tructae]